MCSNPIARPSGPAPPPAPAPPPPPQAERQPDATQTGRDRTTRRRAAGGATPGRVTILGGGTGADGQAAPRARKTLLGQ